MYDRLAVFFFYLSGAGGPAALTYEVLLLIIYRTPDTRQPVVRDRRTATGGVGEIGGGIEHGMEWGQEKFGVRSSGVCSWSRMSCSVTSVHE